MVLLAFLQFFASFHGGMAVASLHSVTPVNMRAQATAVYLFFINLVGLGLGPVIVGVITDYGFGDEAMVGNSLAITGGFATLLALGFLMVARHRFAAMLGQNENA